MNLASYIRDIPDFPKPGILFKDITPLLADPAAFAESIRRLAERYRDELRSEIPEIDAVLGTGEVQGGCEGYGTQDVSSGVCAPRAAKVPRGVWVAVGAVPSIGGDPA